MPNRPFYEDDTPRFLRKREQPIELVIIVTIDEQMASLIKRKREALEGVPDPEDVKPHD